MIRLFTISDRYIDASSKIDFRVLSNHKEQRLHLRPYVGLLLFIDPFDYYLPLSSPDPSDYKSGKVRPSTMTIIRMFGKNDAFIGKILLNNMLPVPSNEVCEISLKKTSDLAATQHHSLRDNQYKDLLIDERSWIESHSYMIFERARVVRNQKIHENDDSYWKGKKKPGYLEATVSFLALEAFCQEWKERNEKITFDKF